jgi:hypothetical protein
MQTRVRRRGMRPCASHPSRRWSVALTALGAFGLAVTFAFAQAPRSAAASREDLVTKLAGKRVRVDATTKQLRAITADEAREFIATVSKATDMSQVAAQTPTFTSSGQMARLDDHTGHIVVSRPIEDGSVSLRCVASADEAVAFLTEEGLPLQ